MQNYNVKSSTIANIQYDVEKLELIVTFNKGTQYKYIKVYPETVTLMLFSESVGSYFMKYIKDGYKCEKL